MIDIIAFITGILIAIIGFGISIALHECGHLYFAKRFNVLTTQYMVGFGPTVWSTKRGETEYGIKAIPLGGYVQMVGMYPPAPGEQAQAKRTGFISQLIEDGRQASAESIPPGQEHRAFYRIPVWQRLLIMFGGPFMNFVVAIVCFMIVASGFGVHQPSLTLETVYRCVVAAGEESTADPNNCETPAPAYAAGLRPGDTIISVNGEQLGSWEQLQGIMRGSADQELQLVYERAGTEHATSLTPTPTERYVYDDLTGRQKMDDNGQPIIETVGFAGFGSTFERVHESPLYAGEMFWQQSRGVVNVVVTMPQRVVEMFQAGFLGAERDPNGPVSVVGVGVITGQIAQQHEVSITDRAATMVGMVAAVNVALGIMNLIPLPPLDGGHIVSALWDGMRKWWARIRNKPEPAPFDTAKLLPLTLVIAGLLIGVGALFIFTDLVNPIQLFE